MLLKRTGEFFIYLIIVLSIACTAQFAIAQESGVSLDKDIVTQWDKKGIQAIEEDKQAEGVDKKIDEQETKNKLPIEDVNRELDGRELDEFDQLAKRMMSIIDSRTPLKTIFVVALEDIILRPVDKEFFFSDKDLSALVERSLSAVRESKLLFLNEILLTEYPQEVIDHRVIRFLNDLQQKGVPTIVITRNTSGKLNKIPYLERWTVELLKKYGFDLSKGQFAGIRLIMDKYSSKERGSYPTFFDGMLSCSSHKSSNSEQNVLATLLVRFGFKPSTVIMLHHDSPVLGVMEEQLHRINPDMEYWGFKFTYDADEYNDQNPKEFLNFWKIYAKKINSVSRGAPDSDAGNPYEEE